MTYRKPSRNSRAGLLIVDILMALALGTAFIVGMTAATLESREIFDRSSLRGILVQAYKDHQADFAALMPYQSVAHEYNVSPTAGSTTSLVNISATAKWYGNDRIETDISAAQGPQSVSFVSIRDYPFSNMADSAGTPLCSPDLGASTTAVIVPVTLPINPLLPLTDIIVRDGIAYISADSNMAADPDLLIIDISDPKNPKLLSSLNTGPGIAAISLGGKYIFAAADSTAAQLHVIRLDSLATPVLAKKYRLPLPTASTSPAVASAIFFNNNVIYLGTEKWDGQELSAIDVSAPESPLKIGGFETGSKVNSIFVRSGLAYVAASDQNQLRVLDVHDPTRISLMSPFSPSGWSRQEGNASASFEDSLVFGRTSGGYDIPTDYELFTWPAQGSTTANIAGSYQSLNIPGGVYGIVVDRHRLYIATHTFDQEFTVLGLGLSTSSASYYPLPVLPQAMTCDQDRLYILAKTAPVIYEISFIKN